MPHAYGFSDGDQKLVGTAAETAAIIARPHAAEVEPV
jgi:hypothetical protein